MGERYKSESSIQSVGLGTVQLANVDLSSLPKPVELCICKLEPEGGAPNGEYVFNCIAMVIYCEKHRQIALSYNDRSQATWLPFIVVPPNKTWNEATQDGLQFIFSKEDAELDVLLTPAVPIQVITCVHILRFQLPITQKFVYRLIQLVKLGSSNHDFECCQDYRRIRWVKLADATAGSVDKLWGPEVAFFAAFVNNPLRQEIYEFGLEQVHYFVPKEGSKRTADEEMLYANGIGHRETEQVYGDFLEHCFPSFFMTYPSFLSYMNDLFPEFHFKTDESIAVQMFHGMNYNRNGYLSFYEFLLGLVTMEPKTPNNEARLKLIFRYYDIDQDNCLNMGEITSMLHEMKVNPASVATHLQQYNGSVNFGVFQELVGSGVLANCNALCRLPFSGIGRICQHFSSRTDRRSVSKRVTDTKLSGPKASDQCQGRCLACRPKKYQFGTHYVKLDPSGRCVEPRQLPDNDLEEEVDQTDTINLARYSVDYVFNTVSIGHTFLDMLREFNVEGKGTIDRPNGFLASSKFREVFIQYLNILCENVRHLFECEPKLVKINSPAFVIGDLRGNLEELLFMERILWQDLPITSHNFVLLGNYSQVGKWGIECVMYLFALKIVAPNKFFLVRGNNEVRSAQQNGFQQECFAKYGTKYGPMVCNMVNEVFDRMCVAVVVDESVLAVNNGLPTDHPMLEDIYNITADLKDPLVDPLAKDLLCSNSRCTDEYIESYLKRNQLSHMIRANQTPLTQGYRITANGRCISVFSSSHYCNKKNESAVVCVDHPKLRIVKLDTSKCASSTSAPNTASNPPKSSVSNHQ